MMNVRTLENTHENTGYLSIGLFPAGRYGEFNRNPQRMPQGSRTITRMQSFHVYRHVQLHTATFSDNNARVRPLGNLAILEKSTPGKEMISGA
jgi:hypothetical protein